MKSELDWLTSKICSGFLIVLVCNFQNGNIKWLLEKLFEFPDCSHKQPWVDFVPIQNPFRMAGVISFPFDYTGFFGANKKLFFKLILLLLSDSFIYITTHSLRYDISFHSGEIVMSQNLN